MEIFCFHMRIIITLAVALHLRFFLPDAASTVLLHLHRPLPFKGSSTIQNGFFCLSCRDFMDLHLAYHINYWTPVRSLLSNLKIRNSINQDLILRAERELMSSGPTSQGRYNYYYYSIPLLHIIVECFRYSSTPIYSSAT